MRSQPNIFIVVAADKGVVFAVAVDDTFVNNIVRVGTVFMLLLLARAGGVPVGRRLCGQLATTLVATKNIFIFFPPHFIKNVYGES